MPLVEDLAEVADFRLPFGCLDMVSSSYRGWLGAYAIRSLKPLAGAEGGARVASRTTSI